MTDARTESADSPDRDVVEVIRRTRARYAGRVAIRELGSGVAGAREITYAELVDGAYNLAAGLGAAGLERGARVAVLLDNGIELALTEWACLVSGLVWVALNARTSAAELERILEDSAPAALFYAERYAGLVDGVAVEARCRRVLVGGAHDRFAALLAEGAAALASGVRVRAPSADEPVRIRYTSGTAGMPKGAVLPRRCYDASLAAVAEVLSPLREDDVLIHVAPMTHASGAMFLPHAAIGARAVVLSHFDAREVLATIAAERATAIFVVPTMLVRLVEAVATAPPAASLRTIVYGGASMPTEPLRHAIERFGPVLVQIYGLTESTWPVAALSREDHLRRPGESEEHWLARLRSCGRPTSIGSLRIVAGDGRESAQCEVGEIRVRGRNTMSGYWNAHSRGLSGDDKGLDEHGWMRTGDVGFRDQEGYVTIVDRLHDMIVSGGFNVYPREVENALTSHPAVLEAAVVGRADVEWGETVHAAVVLKGGARVGIEELVAHCDALLPGYKKPRSLEIVSELPKNAAGKTLRRTLRERLVAQEKGRTR